MAGQLVIEGHAARVHRPGDGLQYKSGEEYRDLAELRRIVDQLPGAPVTLGHPAGMIRDLGKGHRSVRIVGKVDKAWLDGEHAAVRITVDAGAVDDETRELSLGYEVELDAAGYQRGTSVDHLAIVEAARCGESCALRTDENRVDCAPACACRDKRIAPPALGREDGHMTTEEMKAKIDELTGEKETLGKRVKELEDALAEGAQAVESEKVKAEKDRADAAEAKVAQFDSTFEKRADERARLRTEAAAHLPRDFRLDGMTDRQIHEAVVKRLDPTVKLDGESDGHVRGRYTTLISLSARNKASQERVAELLAPRDAAERERKDAAPSHDEVENTRWKKTLSNGRNAAAEGR